MLLRKSIALFMSPILIWASMGFTLSQHYCLGMLMEEHLYHNEAACALALDEGCHENSNSDQSSCSSSEDCCKNIWIQVDQVQVLSFLDSSEGESSPSLDLKLKNEFGALKTRYRQGQSSKVQKEPPPKTKRNTRYLIEIQRFLI